jgi:hypothetical protein
MIKADENLHQTLCGAWKTENIHAVVYTQPFRVGSIPKLIFKRHLSVFSQKNNFKNPTDRILGNRRFI